MRPLNFLLAALLISIATLAQMPQQNKTTEQSGWKTYTNKQYGFTFQHPESWVEDVKINEVINLNEEVTSISIVFKDTKTNSNFTIEYYFAPNGLELYQYAVSQYKSSQGWYVKDGKQIIVAGKEAIEANIISTINGKGQRLLKPLKTIVVEFLDKKQTGEIKIQFRVNAENTIEIENFNKVLSTFEFINGSANNNIK
jgi:hypothetical protein